MAHLSKTSNFAGGPTTLKKVSALGVRIFVIWYIDRMAHSNIVHIGSNNVSTVRNISNYIPIQR